VLGRGVSSKFSPVGGVAGGVTGITERLGSVGVGVATATGTRAGAGAAGIGVGGVGVLGAVGVAGALGPSLSSWFMRCVKSGADGPSLEIG